MDAEGERPRLVVGRIERTDGPSAPTVLADELRRAIYGGAVRPGEHLPPERALVEQTGLGRASVREALHLLETQDLIERRLGRRGGWVVRSPGHQAVARSIEVLIRGQRIRAEALLEAREAIEPACASLAARHRTDADLAELDRIGRDLRSVGDDVPAYLRGNVAWHLAVVAASHNELLIATMTALSDVIHAGSDIEGFNSEAVRDAALHAHDRVVAAIRAGDPDAAARRMHRHVHAFRVQALDAVPHGDGPHGDGPHGDGPHGDGPPSPSRPGRRSRGTSGAPPSGGRG